jgi:hypothetical protein
MESFFLTDRRGASPPFDPPRTVGAVCFFDGDGPVTGHAGPVEALGLSRRYLDGQFARSARGKAVLMTPGRMKVFQVDEGRTRAGLCACGNASAAGLGLLARATGAGACRMIMECPDGWEVPVDALVGEGPRGSLTVGQTWRGIRTAYQEVHLRGRRACVVESSMNDYLIVDGCVPTRGDAAALAAEAAAATGRFRNPATTRVAVVRPGTPTSVRVFSSGRWHPSVPFTGLATLALAARALSWLGPLRRCPVLRTPCGLEALPEVWDEADGASFVFSAIVRLIARPRAPAATRRTVRTARGGPRAGFQWLAEPG